MYIEFIMKSGYLLLLIIFSAFLINLSLTFPVLTLNSIVIDFYSINLISYLYVPIHYNESCSITLFLFIFFLLSFLSFLFPISLNS